MKLKAKILTLVLALAMLFSVMVIATLPTSAATTRTIYLDPGSDWGSAGAWFDAWTWGGSQGDSWETFTDSNYDGIYEITIPSDRTGMKILRKDPASTAHDWSAWGDTGDLTLSSSYNCYTRNGWDAGSWSSIATPDSGYVFSVVGVEGLTGADWDVSINDMTLKSGTIYEKTFTGIATGTYEFKIAAHHAWTYSWGDGSNNASVTVENGHTKSDVTITFDESTKNITATVTPTHTWNEGVVTTDPKCESEGVKTYSCTTTGCSATYTEDVDAIGHDMQETTAAVAPSCESAGATAIKTCANGCGKTEGGAEIPATGHSYTNGSCSVCGESDPNYVPPIVLSVPDGVPSVEMGDGNVLPTAGAPAGYVFAGWSESTIKETTTKPTILEAGSAYSGSATVLYALYTRTETTPGTQIFEKVTETLDDWSGDYLLVYETGNLAFNASLSSPDVAKNTVGVTISNNTIEATEDLKAVMLTMNGNSTDGYTVVNANSKKISTSGYSNTLKLDSTYYLNDISIDSSGNAVMAVVTPDGTVTMRFNKANDQMRFRYYKSGQQAVQLYKLVTSAGSSTTYYLTIECDHSYNSEVTDPTCIDGGYTTYTCSKCGDSYTDNEVAATGVHTYVDGVCSVCGEEETFTVSTIIAEYADSNGWENSIAYYTIIIDNYITATAGTTTVSGAMGDTGKYYTNGENWRFYQSSKSTLTITGASGVTIKSITITYSVSNTGQLVYDNLEAVASGEAYEVNANSITFGVGNTGSATNGQVRITDITVVYSIESDEPICSHTNTTTTTVDATCTETGSTTVTCKDCGETVSTTVITATGHQNTTTTTVDATCAVAGSTTVTCDDCGATISTEEIPATGAHNYFDGTCSVCDAKQVSTGEHIHNFTESGTTSTFYTISGSTSTDKGTVTYNDLSLTTCLKVSSSASISFTAPQDGTFTLVFNSSCSGYTIYINGGNSTAIPGDGIITIDVTAGTNYTITKNKSESFLYYMVYTPNCDHVDTNSNCVCDSCGATVHNYGEGVITTPATCESAGEMTYTCTCDDSYTEVIPATGVHGGDECTCTLVKLYNGAGWESAYCHSWNSTTGNATAWPGQEMTLHVDGYYYAYVPAAHNMVIYNNGNGEQTGDLALEGNEVHYNLVIAGGFNDWETKPFSVIDGVATYTIILEKGEYKFKLIENGTWLGNGGTIDKVTATGWEMTSDAGDCTLNATDPGKYTFTFDFNTNKLSVSWECVHEYGELIEEKPATCIAEGKAAHYQCSVCKALFDEDKNATTEQDLVIDMIDHNYGDRIEEKPATCIAEGKAAHYQCSVCKALFDADKNATTEQALVIDKIAHSYENTLSNSVKNDGTPYHYHACTTEGCTAEQYVGDCYDDDADGDHKCDADGCDRPNVSDHIYPNDGAWTKVDDDQHSRTCSDCSTVENAAHVYDAGVVTAPTCTEDGYTTYTCSCGHSYTDNVVDATGHSFTNYVSNNDTTCEEDGTKTATCDNCSETNTITDTGSKTGHDMQKTADEVAPTCENPGTTAVYTCANGCGKTDGGDEISATGHNMQKTADEVAPGCETTGTTAIYTCANGCGTTEGGVEIPETGHDYDDGWTQHSTENKHYHECKNGCGSMGNLTDCYEEDSVDHYCDICSKKISNHAYSSSITTSATCISEGVKTYTCECGDNYTESIIKLGHSFTGEIKSDSNTENGTHSFKCVNGCNQYGNAVAHSWTVDIITDPTCENKGAIVYICTVDGCGGTYTVEVPANGHNYGELIAKVPADCENDGMEAHYKCSVCNNFFDSSKNATTEQALVIAAIGHDYGDATCTEPAICANCGDESQGAIGHDYDENYECTRCGSILVAKIGDEKFETLQAALDAAQSGETITLLNDVKLSKYADIYTANNGEVARSITLDLAGHSITPANGYNYNTGYPLVFVGINQTLNINDTIGGGLISADSKVTVGVYGMLYINDGTIKNTGTGEEDVAVSTYHWDHNDAGYDGIAIGDGAITGGEVIGSVFVDYESEFAISGGKIDLVENYGETIISGGKVDLVENYGETTISGGQFNSKFELDLLAPGKALAYNGENYEVVDAVVEINGIGYATLQEALDAAQSGDTVKLLSDIKLSKYADIYTANNGEVARSITLDLAGHSITPANGYNYNTGYPLVFVGINQTLNINDSIGGGLISADSKVTVGVYGMLYINDGTIENTGTGEEDVAVSTYHWDHNDAGYDGIAIGDGAITGGEVIGSVFVDYESEFAISGGKIDLVENYGETIISGGDISEVVVYSGNAIITTQVDSINADARIDNVYYATLQDAVNVGGTVTLLRDVELSAPLTISKSVTINATGKNIVSTAINAIQINNVNAAEITINANSITNTNSTAPKSAVITITNSTYVELNVNATFIAAAERTRTGSSTTVNKKYILSSANVSNVSATINSELVLANNEIFNGDPDGISAFFKADYADELALRGYVTQAASDGMVEVIDSVPYYIGSNGNWWLGDVDTGVPATGPEGPQGPQGPAGTGIVSIVLDEARSTDTQSIYVVTLSNDTSYDIIVKHGEDGEDGEDGDDANVKFEIRDDGYLYVSYDGGESFTKLDKVVGEDGISITGVELSERNLIVRFSNGTYTTLDNVVGENGKTPEFKIEEGKISYSYDGINWSEPVNIKGEQGDPGAAGTIVNIDTAPIMEDGKKIGTLVTIYLDNNVYKTFEILDGKDGKDAKVLFDIDEATGNLLVSYDGGEHWSDLGKVVGENGADGTIIESIEIDNDGYLVITYKGGTSQELGPVVGAPGAPGAPGSSGSNGTNGTDGITPEFKVDETTGDIYVSYGKLDESGNVIWGLLGNIKGPQGDPGANAITPVFKVENGVLYVSYDGKAIDDESKDWESLATVKGEPGSAGADGTIIEKIEINDDGYLVITYKGGTSQELGPVVGAPGAPGAPGSSGSNGTNGTDGITPEFKVDETTGDIYVSYGKLDESGNVIWELLGNIKGPQGIPGTNAITPIFKVESGNLLVSYDNGTSWEDLGEVQGPQGETGATGKPGADGNDGQDGQNGKDGLGIKEIVIEDDGDLAITYTDGKVVTIGNIMGRPGLNGMDGVTPKFKIEENILCVSYDEGKTWTELVYVKGDTGETGPEGPQGETGKDGNDNNRVVIICIGIATLCLITTIVAVTTKRFHRPWWILC